MCPRLYQQASRVIATVMLWQCDEVTLKTLLIGAVVYRQPLLNFIKIGIVA